MLTEMQDVRTIYSHGANEIRSFVTPEEREIKVTRMSGGNGGCVYYASSGDRTLYIGGREYWGDGMSWEEVTKYMEEYAKKP